MFELRVSSDMFIQSKHTNGQQPSSYYTTDTPASVSLVTP